MQIVGIMLVHNEDVFIERAIRNVVDFCDRIIITDHQSTDRTFEICRWLVQEFPKIELRSIRSASESATAIEPYCGTNTWIFGVDGDEIYDPLGLQIMKRRLLEGHFSKDWCVFGNVLNITLLDLKNKRARGHLAPPSRSMTKLYNFSMIERWVNCPEKLLGGELTFKSGFSADLRRYLHEELPWEESYFRCLHTVFVRRSSSQKIQLLRTRLNPDEKNAIRLETNPLFRMLRAAKILAGQFLGRDWKNQKYRRGPLVEMDVSAFFPEA